MQRLRYVFVQKETSLDRNEKSCHPRHQHSMCTGIANIYVAEGSGLGQAHSRYWIPSTSLPSQKRVTGVRMGLCVTSHPSSKFHGTVSAVEQGKDSAMVRFLRIDPMVSSLSRISAKNFHLE